MGFRIDDWPSVRQLEELIVRGGSSDEAIAFSQEAMALAAARGDESERVYLGGRLAEIIAWKGRLDAAATAYGEIWPGVITPAVYGLPYAKVLLQLRRDQDATEVVQQMEKRVAGENADPARSQPSYIDMLSLLLGQGLLQIRRNDMPAVKVTCENITRLRPHLPWLPYVDTAFLEALVSAHEYDLARQILDFIASVCPRKRH